LNLKCDILVSKLAFKFNLYRCTEVVGTQRSSDVAVLLLSPLPSTMAAAAAGWEGVGGGVAAAVSSSLSRLPLRAMPIGASGALKVGQSCYAVGRVATPGGCQIGYMEQLPGLFNVLFGVRTRKFNS
jgi:hypothetical protein